jgi:hypothetical protein
MHYNFVVIYTPTYVSTTYWSSSGGSKYINTDYTSTIIVGIYDDKIVVHVLVKIKAII